MQTNHISADHFAEIVANQDAMLRGFCLFVVTLTLLFLVPHSTQAAAGELDPRFGNGGVVQTDFAQTDDYVLGVGVQPDGKILVCGQSGIYPDLHSALVRYNRNGRLDSAFGTGGKVVVMFHPNSDYLDALVLQSGGKIVAAGSASGTAFLVARFNADGTLDQTFGNNGSVQTTFGDPTAAAHDVILQSGGRIIAVGVSGAGPYSELNDFVLARYNIDGSLDPTFGNGGKVKTHFPGVTNTGSTASSIALQLDGKLVVGGSYKNEGTPHQFALARYNANGSLDSTFGNAGKVVTFIGAGDAFATALVIQSNGRIVLTGYSETTQDHDFTLAGYTSNGTPDSTFGNAGLMTTDFSGGSDDIPYAMALQSDGKLVVVGQTGDYPELDFALARYNVDGQLDQGFGTAGKVTTDTSLSDHAYDVALQRDKIVLAGIALNGTNFDFTVARYLAR
jgi:uncharacterized delta-60 repeat protein